MSHLPVYPKAFPNITWFTSIIFFKKKVTRGKNSAVENRLHHDKRSLYTSDCRHRHREARSHHTQFFPAGGRKFAAKGKSPKNSFFPAQIKTRARRFAKWSIFGCTTAHSRRTWNIDDDSWVNFRYELYRMSLLCFHTQRRKMPHHEGVNEQR